MGSAVSRKSYEQCQKQRTIGHSKEKGLSQKLREQHDALKQEGFHRKSNVLLHSIVLLLGLSVVKLGIDQQKC